MSEHPRFPVELIEIIILEAWSSPLSVDERITFMTSSLLVNKTWKAEFTRVSSKDVHIPCASYADQYLRVLREDSSNYDEPTAPINLCNFLTFHLHSGSMPTPPITDSHNMGQVLSTILFYICTLSYLPNLQKVSIDFLNWAYDDIFDNYWLTSFPDQVSELELKFAFDEHTSPLEHIRRTALKWSMPSIRRLSVLGASDHFLADLASVCPKAETCTAGP